MEEIWKDIPRYEGKYQVSNMGRVKSLSREIHSNNQNDEFTWTSKERILKPGKHDIGNHLSVVLYNPKRTQMVHQLVMLAFVGPPPEGMCVLHTNGDATDNRLENLRYDTQSENIYDVYRQGKAWKTLTADDVGGIKFGLWCGISCTELGRMFGVFHQTISKIKKGDRHAWIK
mgnify:CR=1 FL=1